MIKLLTETNVTKIYQGVSPTAVQQPSMHSHAVLYVYTGGKLSSYITTHCSTCISEFLFFDLGICYIRVG